MSGNFTTEMRDYLRKHKVEQKMNEILNISLRGLPSDPFASISQLLKLQAPSLQGLLSVKARSTFDGLGRAAIEVMVTTRNGVFRSSVSTGIDVPDVLPIEQISETTEEENKQTGENSQSEEENLSEAEKEKIRLKTLKNVILSYEDYHNVISEVVSETSKFVTSANVAGALNRQDPTDQRLVDSMLKVAFRKREQSDAKKQMQEEKEQKLQQQKYDEDGVLETVEMRKKKLAKTLKYNVQKIVLRCASLAVSQAVCRAGAKENSSEVYSHLADLAERPDSKYYLPVPVFSLLSSGNNSSNCTLPIRSLHVVPSGAKNFSEAVQFATLLEEAVDRLAPKKMYRAANGGFIPEFIGSNTKEVGASFVDESDKSDEKTPGLKEAVDYLNKCIIAAQCEGKVMIGMSIAASNFFHVPNAGKSVKEENTEQDDMATRALYDLGYKCNVHREEDQLEAEDLVAYIKRIVKRYAVCFVDDPLMNDALSFWGQLQNSETKSGNPLVVVADTLVGTTNFKMGQQRGCFGGAVLNAARTCSSVTETIELCKSFQSGGTAVIVANTPGSTSDTFSADLAVAMKVEQFRVGSTCRAEDTEKLGRLLVINSQLGEKNVSYVGKQKG